MPRQLWQALESVPGLATVDAEWKALAGPDAAVLRSFLRPNGSLAASFPCPLPKGCGCAHEVVAHSDDDIVAVCRCEAQCPAISLTKSDIILYEVNRSALGKAVAAALQLVADEGPADGLHHTHRVGFYSPFAGHRFPVVLTVQCDPDDMNAVVESLVAAADKPLIVLAPTAQFISPALDELLKRKNAMFLSLEDVVDIDGAGGCKPGPRLAQLIAEFRSRNIPEADASSPTVFFPTPPDATWRDVSIRFVDGHTVFVKVKETTGKYLYSDMGMVDRRNATPDSQWELLQGFAEGNGTFTWAHPTAHKKKQKQRETLATRLGEFFRLDGDPFEYVEDVKGWRARFTIIPES